MPIYTAFRGQHGKRHGRIESRQKAVYLGDEAIAWAYAFRPNDPRDKIYKPHVLEVTFEIKNPFMNNPSDAFIELSAISEKLGDRRARAIAKKFAFWIEQTDHWKENYGIYKSVRALLKVKPETLSDLYFQAFAFFDDYDEVRHLQVLGYDGAIHAGTAVSANTVEYCIFGYSKYQIKNISIHRERRTL